MLACDGWRLLLLNQLNERMLPRAPESVELLFLWYRRALRPGNPVLFRLRRVSRRGVDSVLGPDSSPTGPLVVDLLVGSRGEDSVWRGSVLDRLLLPGVLGSSRSSNSSQISARSAHRGVLLREGTSGVSSIAGGNV